MRVVTDRMPRRRTRPSGVLAERRRKQVWATAAILVLLNVLVFAFSTAWSARALALAVSLLGHHRVEEETLLAPYERRNGTLGPLRCLRHEHEQMNQLVRAAFRAPEPDRMREHIAALLEVVRRHLAREEQLLFAAARQALPAAEREHSGTHWAEFRGVKLPG